MIFDPAIREEVALTLAEHSFTEHHQANVHLLKMQEASDPEETKRLNIHYIAHRSRQHAFAEAARSLLTTTKEYDKAYQKNKDEACAQCGAPTFDGIYPTPEGIRCWPCLDDQEEQETS